jgi:hypothetical protein
LVRTHHQVQIVTAKELSDNIAAKGERNTAIILTPPLSQ